MLNKLISNQNMYKYTQTLEFIENRQNKLLHRPKVTRMGEFNQDI